MSVKVRPALPSDDAAVGELLVEAFVSGYARKMPHIVVTDERKATLRDVARKREIATVLVAEVEGRVVGTVALFPPGAPSSEAWLPNAADLRHLAVAPSLHGKGLSKALLDEAERVARESDYEAICLHVRRGAHGVAGIYRKRGFLPDPKGDIEYPSVSLEAFVLRLK